MLLVDGVKYILYKPKSEEELEKYIEEKYEQVFGEDTLYYPVKTTLRSIGGIGSIPDAYAIKLSEPHCWYLVEVEMSTHSIFSHIVPQLNKFVQGLNDHSSRRTIVEALYNQIKSNPVTEALVKEKIGSGEIYRFLNSLIDNQPILVVVIDEKNQELEEACNSIPLFNKKTIEFKIYERVDSSLKTAYLFETITQEKRSPYRTIPVSKEPSIARAQLPKKNRNWDEQLEWTNPEIKQMALKLQTMIVTNYSNILPRASGSAYMYCKGKQGNNFCFAAIIVQKKRLAIRVRYDPSMSSDPNNILKDKVYKWFISGNGEEREFYLNNESEFKQAMSLISQSYSLT